MYRPNVMGTPMFIRLRSMKGNTKRNFFPASYRIISRIHIKRLPLGDLAYDEDFLQKAKKIKGIKEIWPVIEVPVVIKIEDYTETTTFSGIDMNAFGKNPTQNELGKMPLLL